MVTDLSSKSPNDLHKHSFLRLSSGGKYDESYQNSTFNAHAYGNKVIDVDGASIDEIRKPHYFLDVFGKVASQIPAIAIVSVLNFMIGIPFGASYFPVEWSNSGSNSISHDGDNEQGTASVIVDGEFPLPGKESLGLRMFLFSTMMAQLVFTFKSKFTNAVGLQMVEVRFLLYFQESINVLSVCRTFIMIIFFLFSTHLLLFALLC